MIEITLPENRKVGSFLRKNLFMFFDRNEIHIQAFGEIPPGKLIPGDSSSSTFHDSIILSYYNYQNFRTSEFQKFKTWKAKVSKKNRKS